MPVPRPLGLPLRHKMILVVLVASAVALLLVAVAVVVYEVTTFRPRVENDVQALAEVLGRNLHAPLNFDDPRAAEETLASVASTPEILHAAVYRADGRHFASYPRRADVTEASSPAPAPGGAGAVYRAGRLELTERIVYEDEHLGYLVLYRYLPPLFQRLPQYALMVGVVLLALLVVSVLLSLGLERLVSAPLLELSKAAETVRDQQDYTVRVRRPSGDEIGDLSEAFNEMLAAIDQRETALREVARDLERGRRELQRQLHERRRVEGALRDSERFTQKIADSIPSLLYVQDLETRRNTYVNREVETMLGYPLAAVLGAEHGLGDDDTTGSALRPRGGATRGDGLVEVPRPEDPAARAERLRRLGGAADGEIVESEYRVRRADGTFRWLYSRDTVFERDAAGRPRLVLGVAQDVSEQKVLREQLVQAQKMESIGRLAGGIAHDFNNLLTVIVGSTDLLAAEIGRDPKLGPFLDNVHRASEQAADLTHQLLAFARRQVIEPTTLDLGELALEAESMLRSMAGGGVELAVVPSAGLWPVRADRGQVMQVMMNLTVNARDAMPDGGRLTLAIHNQTVADEAALPGVPPGRWVVLEAVDTGVGMDEATRARVFEPFFTTKEPGKGTGLGLSTCYGIVKQAEGHVAVDSEPGVGSTFRVYLPAIDTLGGRRSRSAEDVAPGGEETLLVVEDDPLVRATSVAILRAQGYEVREAVNGADALELCDGDVELLVTDVVMPQMSGTELARRLLRVHPGLRILYVSGYSADATVLDATRRAGSGFLQKPYTSDRLIRKVREVLDR